jgi:hypothetical protein
MNWFAIVMQILPLIKNAVEIVSKSTGKTPEQAVQEVMAHLTPGAPNASALGPDSKFKAPQG